MQSVDISALSAAAEYLDPPDLDDAFSAGDRAELERDWHTWLTRLFPDYCRAPFGEHHAEFWTWAWAIRSGRRPPPFVGIWPRGGAKSTSAELGVVAIGARGQRRYGLYICETQEQADDHVANIAALLETPALARAYPQLAARMVGKYGNSKGWRRNRLRTNAGFTIDAIGLDSAARGVKLEDARPDFMVIDDIDGELDSADVTAKKSKTLTRKLIPAGASDLAVLAIQNLVHPDSIFAQLVDGRADFLSDRHLSGPVPALRDLTYEQVDGRYRLVTGSPTWPGQDLDRCQEQVADMGLSAFLAECQHDVEPPSGGMFDHLDFQHIELGSVPDLVRVVVWVDPAVTDTKNSDSHGIQADGIDERGRLYRLFSWEQRASPVEALSKAITKAFELKAEHVGVETDQGGDTWSSVYREAMEQVLKRNPEFRFLRPPTFTYAKAGAGHGPKAHRASKMLVDYEGGRIFHVIGTHLVLEKALRRFPKTKPFDLVDVAYWSWYDLTEAPRVTSGEYEDDRLRGRR